MQRHALESQFGWEGDGGIGDRLIRQILLGRKTATHSPKAGYSAHQLAELKSGVDQPWTVVDKEGRPRCNIRLLEVFETTFGSPDPRGVAGEGYGTDVGAFQRSHRTAWSDLELTDATELVVELFELLPGEVFGELVEADTLTRGKIPWPRQDLFFRPTAYGFVLDEHGNLLLTVSRLTGKYALPGGALEPGERIHEALRREVMEECGIQVDVGPLGFFHENFFVHDVDAWACHTLGFFHLCRAQRGELRCLDPEDDSQEPRWVPLQTLQAEQFVNWGQEIIGFLDRSGLRRP